MSPCTQEACDQPMVALGLCRRHYARDRSRRRVAAAKATEHTCVTCGATFSGSTRRAPKYCSRRCKDRAAGLRRRSGKVPRAETRPARQCVQCGNPISRQKLSHAKFCSGACKTAAYRVNHPHQPVARTRPPRACVRCGSPIAPDRKMGTKFCSRDCAIRSPREADNERRRHRDRGNCLTCGQALTGCQTKYCSGECGRVAIWARTYGMSPADLQSLIAQHVVCAICATDNWGAKGPCVDHDHATGRVRGALCGNCNKALGLFADDPVRLRSAIAYLEAHTT